MRLSDAPLYWRTVRHLRPVQVSNRLIRVLPSNVCFPQVSARHRSGPWTAPTGYVPTLLTQPCRLRDYMLHYQHGAGLASILDWIQHNPPPAGTGWEPYPLSLRIVNWVKWLLSRGEPHPGVLASLAAQADYLSRRIEWHLLANHLFVNAKALVFAGVFFDWPELLSPSRRLLQAQIEEQILADGGHFERSPMYHCLILEDLLDLVNLSRAYPGCLPDYSDVARRMLGWMGSMCHPDGRIAFFNDSTFGVAPEPDEICAYARRLGITASSRGLGESGFARLENAGAVVIMDAGSPSPSYQPGHSHAEALSFELAAASGRVIVNRGISTYDNCDERRRQRGTAAHNTVVIDGRDQSELWGAFRMGARARTFDVTTDRRVVAEAAHDGYTRLSSPVVHRRRLELLPDRLVIADWIEGFGRHDIEVWLHSAPGVEPRICWDPRLSVLALASSHHPGFERSVPATSYVGRWSGECPVQLTTEVFLTPMESL